MSEQAPQAKILARVRKMMRLAQDAGATEGERETAMRHVHATLAKYNLSLGQVEASDEAANEARERLRKAFLGKPWAIQIAAAIARMYFCRYYYSTMGGNAGPTQKAMHTFVGRHSNVITAQEMAEFVVGCVNREAQRFQRKIGGRYGEYRAFAQGAAEKIRLRCYQIQKESEEKGVIDDPELLTQSTPGTALVIAGLYKTEDEANKQYLQKIGVELGKGRSQSYAEGYGARIAGREFGSKVSLNRQVK
jgi:hypothetical protein